MRCNACGNRFFKCYPMGCQLERLWDLRGQAEKQNSSKICERKETQRVHFMVFAFQTLLTGDNIDRKWLWARWKWCAAKAVLVWEAILALVLVINTLYLFLSIVLVNEIITFLSKCFFFFFSLFVCERKRPVLMKDEGFLVLLLFNNKHVWNNWSVNLGEIFPQL